MAYFLGIYDWSLFTMPGDLTQTNIQFDTMPNDPTAPDYNPGAPSWVGQDYTYNGGAPTTITVNDDDGDFEDGYVETGAAATLDEAVTINGTTYPAGSIVENEFSLVDATGQQIYVVRINGENVGFTYAVGDEPQPGETFTSTEGLDGDPADNGSPTGSADPYATIVCFAPGTMIETPTGPRRIETLRPGDPVLTRDSGAQPIRWVSRRLIEFGNEPDAARPIEIKAGAFGPGMPAADLIVSPQHRILGTDLRGAFPRDVLAPAKGLVHLPKVRQMRGKKSIEYIHFACDRHQIVWANNLPTETCYIGPVSLSSVPARERSGLERLFPKLRQDPARGYGPLARLPLRVQQARTLAACGKLHLATDGALAQVFTQAPRGGLAA